MTPLESILYEHTPSGPLFAGSHISDDDARGIFRKLEEILEESWKSQPRGKFWRAISDGEAERYQPVASQHFMKCDYRNWSLTPNQYVGVIQTRQLRLIILPKIFEDPRRNPNSLPDQERRAFLNEVAKDLLYMLSYCELSDAPSADVRSLAIREKLDPLEVFIFLFASKALAIYSRSHYATYETLSENLPFLRGKIEFPAHIRQNLLANRHEKIYCSYSQWQTDNLFNQIVKFVASSLLHRCKTDEVKGMLRGICALLHDVNDRVCTANDCTRVTFNQTQREFLPILNLCRLFLGNNQLQFFEGGVDVFCLLLDMNVVFEAFVAGFLDRHFNQRGGLDFRFQRSDLYLTEQKRFRIIQDIYVEQDGRPLCIVDTKYKPTSFQAPDGKGGISQGDIYQVLSYCVRSDCPNAILLYPHYPADLPNDDLGFNVRDAMAQKEVSITASKVDVTCGPKSWAETDERLRQWFGALLRHRCSYTPQSGLGPWAQ